MNYEDMSDFEINKAVAVKLGFRVTESLRWSDDQCWVKALTKEGKCGIFDYAGNPSDAWPIITSNDINLSKHKADGYWFAFTRAEDLGVSEFKCKDNNPLRAAMICFLKMKDAEK